MLTPRSGIVERWDAVVVGAGPAGCTTATVLARNGLNVLLVELRRLPRPKACGGCLSAGTLELLARAGLDRVPSVAAAPVFNTLELRARGRSVRLRTPAGRAVSRGRFDADLAAAARDAGVLIREGFRARIGPVRGGCRTLELTRNGEAVKVAARVVVCATGLVGALGVGEPAVEPRVVGRGRLGVGALLPIQGAVPRETIVMAVSEAGYAGVVEAEGGLTAVAAAVDRGAVRQESGLAGVVAEILREAGAPLLPGLTDAEWHATPPLSRRVAVPAAERLFLVGDAAGYEEPFTGEGIKWALASSLAVAELVGEGVREWRPGLVDAWTRRHRRLLAGERRRCQLVARAVRSPLLVRAAIRILSALPAVAGPLVRGMATPPRSATP